MFIDAPAIVAILANESNRRQLAEKLEQAEVLLCKGDDFARTDLA